MASLPVVPANAPPALLSFLQDTVEALTQLMTPQGPTLVWATLEAALPLASIDYANTVALVTDKKCLVVCTLNSGAWAWTRADGSAL